VRLETLKKEEAGQFAHPGPSEINHWFENPHQESSDSCEILIDLRSNARCPEGWTYLEKAKENEKKNIICENGENGENGCYLTNMPRERGMNYPRQGSRVWLWENQVRKSTPGMRTFNAGQRATHREREGADESRPIELRAIVLQNKGRFTATWMRHVPVTLKKELPRPRRVGAPCVLVALCTFASCPRCHRLEL
jgi:hypothetical protein